ncbi:receptor-like protein EIX1 [Silene latifolia]|uniref:receptor-like protein EIX1 n=1 Tax=Silene latifolia TaxID=37657 RepID=UPI003D785612
MYIYTTCSKLPASFLKITIASTIKMKSLYPLVVLILLSWLVLSPCICYLTPGHNRSNHIQCIDRERDALLHFKHGITTDNCGLLTSWEPHTDCCRWRGVLCSNLTSHVIKLNLGSDAGLCLEGKVSPTLGELKHLKHLHLNHNNFHGEIPHHLGNLSKLITLDLYLAYGDVLVHSLSWISRLTLLRYLDLTGANLSQVTNWITIVNSLPSLRVLSMISCELSTIIPSSFSYVNSSVTLHTINLSENHFNDSSIFQWLFKLPRITNQLVHLDLSWNVIQVPIPSEFENFHSLSYLDLSGKGFQGSIFKIISKLCNLEQLYLKKNNFTDELSNVIHSLVKCNNSALLALDLRSNRFWGGIPDNIGSLSSLKELYLGGNKLKGEISLGIRQLTMLENLDVSSNSLNGTLTHTHLLGLSRLRKLYLSNNPGLVINIEEDWIPPFKLDVIQLRSCRLGPRFPKWLQLQTNCSYFDVSKTGISDSIPVSFCNSLSSPNLLYLNIICLIISFTE